MEKGLENPLEVNENEEKQDRREAASHAAGRIIRAIVQAEEKVAMVEKDNSVRVEKGSKDSGVWKRTSGISGRTTSPSGARLNRCP